MMERLLGENRSYFDEVARIITKHYTLMMLFFSYFINICRNAISRPSFRGALSDVMRLSRSKLFCDDLSLLLLGNHELEPVKVTRVGSILLGLKFLGPGGRLPLS
jgi:hypothetical protein